MLRAGWGDGRPVDVPTRLLASLDRLEHGRVAVVSGPAGYGKSELVETWLSRHPEFSWLEVEADDLATVRNRLDATDTNQLVVAVVKRPELVADHALVRHLLDLAERQPRLRVVFVGRSRPDAPLGSLAARGLLVDLDADQLAWTRAEVAAALRPVNPDLPESTLDTIMESMLGWPAVARMLAAEPLTFAHTAKVSRLADSYIAEAVLDEIGPEDVTFLQELSPLTTFEPLGASWMTGRGDAAAQLSRLQAHGVPITWDDGNTIRLNPVLRAHLNRQLAREHPEAARDLDQRAALWLRNRGRCLEAIALAMQVGLVDLAWMLAGEFITVTMSRPELVESLPRLEAVLPPGWELDTVRSISRGLATPQTLIAQMGAIDAESMVAGTDTSRLGYATFALSMAQQVGYPDDVDVSLALEVAEQADPRSLHELDMALLAAARLELGLWQLNHGLLEEGTQTLLGALGVARVVTVPWVLVECLGTLAMGHAMEGSVEAARRLADEAILTTRGTTFTTDSLDEPALLALALTAIDTGELAAAAHWLEAVDGHAHHPATLDALRTHVRASLLTARNEPEAALGLVVAYRDQPRQGHPAFHELLVARAAFDAAAVLGDVRTMREEFGRMAALDLPDRVTGLVVQEARLALALHDPQRAFDLLHPLAEQRTQHFVHAKNTLYMLMIHGVAADDLHRTDEALQSFQRAGVLAERLGLDTPTARHTKVAVASRKDVPLTEAERHVLASLDSTRTLGETAEALFISPNTLKTHLRRIYRKLGVANREQALERARVMGLREPLD